ncbi:4Fe-4S ferredoxin [Psychrilyobacter sp.]|uniref:4Fe-4S ferredoxin n=1 Tax=Psychrilyobacter sp. TaxID=2586924 RepID=UPI003015A81A
MENITIKIRAIAKQALINKEVDKILGWKKGDLWSESYPAFITKPEDAETLIWDLFCINNLSKYLIKELQKHDKIGIFIKGCDSTSFNQLLKDNRINRENVVLYGIPCEGMIDPEKVKKLMLNDRVKEIKKSENGFILNNKNKSKDVLGEEIKYDKCLICISPNPVVYDQLLTDEVENKINKEDRFKGVEEIESMTPDERYNFWKGEFQRCIRCNACRDICPACSCVKCVFDNCDIETSGKTKIEAEDTFFHIVRAYHVAGRCVDCGECARVCPAGISLNLLNQKIIKDISEIYGEFNAGLDSTTPAPLVTFKLEDSDTFSKQGGK